MSLQYRLDKRNKESKLYSVVTPFRIDVQADIKGPSMTRQEFTDECDINALMARYEKHGVWPYPETGREAVYYDFVGMPNLQEAMAQMMDAESAFMSLPAIVRKEFDNDALRFVEYAQDGSNLEQLRKWGLAKPEEAPEPPFRVEVVNPSPPIAPAPGAPAPAS